MKKIFLYTLSVIGLLTTSCSKSELETPEFDVTVSPTSILKVGQQITFNISGNPQNITFYSGEKNKKYENRARNNEKGTQILQFSSQAFVGDALAANNQTDNLKIKVSTNFNGSYDAAGIAAATWTDITSRAVISGPSPTPTGTNVASGPINLGDFSTAGSDKPIYLAFHYYSPSNTQKPRQYNISALTLNNTLADGTVNALVTATNTAGFKFVDLKNPARVWGFSGATLFNGAAGIGEAENEDWAISGPIDLNRVITADPGVILKNTSAGAITTYTYLFTVAGTYKVTFVASNNSQDGARTVVKELMLTIAP
jgi:hypothetical protein